METKLLPSRKLVTQVIADAFDLQMSGSPDKTGRPGGPLHFLDITASKIPLVVERWQLERDNGEIVDLCFASATRTLSGSDEIDELTNLAVVAIFQLCQHGVIYPHCWPHQPITRTCDIGKLDETAKLPKQGPLGYMVLVFERDGIGVCTLLSPKRIFPKEKRVILVINPNHIGREFAIS